MDSVREDKLVFEKEYRKLEAEVGPIKYIAEFVYGETDKSILEKAVTWVIILIIVVFDPLAVGLLIASQYAFQRASGNQPLETGKVKVIRETVEIDDTPPKDIQELERQVHNKMEK